MQKAWTTKAVQSTLGEAEVCNNSSELSDPKLSDTEMWEKEQQILRTH